MLKRVAPWGWGAWVPTQTSLALGYPSEAGPLLGSDPFARSRAQWEKQEL